MLANIVSHSKQNDTTTTIKFGSNTLRENVVLTIEDIVDGTILSDLTLSQTLANLKTKFVLGFPYITYPSPETLITPTTICKASEPVLNDAIIGLVDAVHWQASPNEDFSTIVFDRKYTKDQCPDQDITKFDPKHLVVGSGFYYLRLRYIIANITSPWSVPLKVNMPSLKVQVPTITMEDNELTPKFTVSSYTLTPDVIRDEGQDDIKEVIWGLSEIPRDADTEYVDRLLASGFTPDYGFKRLATDPDHYTLQIPFRDLVSGANVKLEANKRYVVTCTLVGNRYVSSIVGKIFTAGNYKVLPPRFTVRQFELKPEISIRDLEVSGGSDTLEEYRISIIERTDTGPVTVHTISTPANFYNVREDICKPNTTYDFSIIAIGRKYGPSDPGVISITMPPTGIRPPRINIANRGIEPYITLSPFETINSGDRMRGTEWELYNHANIEGDRLIERWLKENNDTFLRIPKSLIETNTNYKIRVRYLGHKYRSPWVEEAFKTINIVVSEPVVTVTTLGLTITADIAGYNVVGDIDTPASVVWNVYEVRDVIPLDPNDPPTEEIVRHLIENREKIWAEKQLRITVRDGVKRNTKYKIEGKIIGNSYTSPVSQPKYIVTPNIFVVKPTLTVTGAPNQVPKFPTLKGSAFATNMETDTHISTTWKLKDTSDNIILERVEDRYYLTEYIILDDLLMPNTDYILEVTYHGDLYGSSETATIEFKTRRNFIDVPEDDFNTVLIGDDSRNETTKYYGRYTFDRLNNTRDYLGVWDGTYEYPYDSQVLYGGRLWRALDTTMYSRTNNHLNLNREPGVLSANGITYWEEDLRYTLPTYQWLLKQIGLQPNIQDNHSTGITTLSNKRGEYKDKDTSGVSKYMVGMKVLYVYDDTEIINISRNDLAIVGLVGRGRTIRIGERLYWLRLLTEAEHTELHRFIREEDTGNVIAFNKDVETWLANETTSETESSYGLTDGTIGSEVATKRNKALRLVLEYIPAYEEPWLFARRQYPTLQYDRYTDTGYFGTVDANNYDFQGAIGLTVGTKINRNTSLLAFYNHGKRILVNRMSISYGVSFDKLVELQCVYGKDVKLNGYNGVTIDNFNSDNHTYNVRLLRGGFSYIDLPDEDQIHSDTMMAANNLFKGSEWNELIYRVALQIPNHKDRNPFHGGWQIGRNWDSMDNINVGVFEHFSGNGCHDYVLSFVSNGRIMSRGGTKLEAVYLTDIHNARNDHGVRLVLEDKIIFSKDGN